METEIVKSLIQQVPSASAVIAVVMLFLRSLEKRDQLFYDQMAKLTERINSMENVMIGHDAKMDEALAAMSRAKARNAKKK